MPRYVCRYRLYYKSGTEYSLVMVILRFLLAVFNIFRVL